MTSNSFAAFEPHTAYTDSASERTASTSASGTIVRFWRWIATLVAVSALALALAGSMAELAGAAARPNLGTAAERCADMNGNATVYGFFGVNFTYCDWGDGHSAWALD